jgi:hypothetical protein
MLCACLPDNVRLASPQRCSPARNGRFARPCDRSTYTYMSSGRSPARLVSFSRVPLRWRRRSKPRLAPSGVRRGARGLGLSHAPCAAAPVVFAAIRAAMLRRRDTVSSPCDVSHRASDEPRRRMSLSSALAPSSLASPSTRRVFLRSIFARRRPVSELNNSCIPHEAVGRVELISGCCGGLKGFNM